MLATPSDWNQWSSNNRLCYGCGSQLGTASHPQRTYLWNRYLNSHIWINTNLDCWCLTMYSCCFFLWSFENSDTLQNFYPLLVFAWEFRCVPLTHQWIGIFHILFSERTPNLWRGKQICQYVTYWQESTRCLRSHSKDTCSQYVYDRPCTCYDIAQVVFNQAKYLTAKRERNVQILRSMRTLVSPQKQIVEN